MYGEKALEKERIGKSFLRIDRIGDNIFKIHVETPYSSEDLIVPVDREEEIRFYPVLPIHSPKLITTYILYSLFTPIIVNSRDKVTFTLETLLEIGVALYSHSKRTSVNYIYFLPPEPMKYALYGPPEGGVIARLNPTRVHVEDPRNITAPDYRALTKVSIYNYSDEVVRIEKLLVNASQMNIYYDDYDRAYTNELEVGIVSRKKGHILATRRVPLPGLNKSIDPLTYSTRFLEPLVPIEGLYRDEKKTIMQYGFASWVPRH